MRPFARVWGLIAALALLSSCGSDVELAPDGAPIVSPDDFPDAPDSPNPTSTEDPSPTFVFALYERIVEEVANPSPVQNGTEDSQTHAVKRIVWTEGAATYEEQLCHTWGNVVFGTRWSFVSDFAEQRGLVDRSVNLAIGTSFEAGPYLDLLGTDVLSGSLPTTPDQSGVVDTDGDSLPGHTVFVTNDLLGSGETRIVQRSTTTLMGGWIDDVRASGEIVTESEQNTIDATTWWLQLDAASGVPQPDDTYWVLVKVEPDMDCAAIYDARGSLQLMDRP